MIFLIFRGKLLTICNRLPGCFGSLKAAKMSFCVFSERRILFEEFGIFTSIHKGWLFLTGLVRKYLVQLDRSLAAFCDIVLKMANVVVEFVKSTI
jgi:hypothetical protein